MKRHQRKSRVRFKQQCEEDKPFTPSFVHVPYLFYRRLKPTSLSAPSFLTADPWIFISFKDDITVTILLCVPEPEFANLLRIPGIDSQASGPVRQPNSTYRPTSARICKPFKEPRNRFPTCRAGTIPLSCQTGPPGYIGWRNRFLSSLNVYKYELRLHRLA